MSTTLPRTMITHTSEVQHALEVAEKRWPGQRPSALLLRLIEEGVHVVEAGNDELAARQRAVVAEVAGKYTGMFGPGYLEELREGWPE